MPVQGKPFEVFCSYDPKDEALCLELEKHLKPLQRQGQLALWHHRKIIPGTNWAESIDTHLNQADLILLLISPDFLNSDYCYGVEMTRALQRQESNEARVIPVLLRASLWKKHPLPT